MTVIGIRICLSFSSCCVHGCAQSTRFASVRSVSCFYFSLVFFFHSLCFFCYYIFLYFYRQPASQSIRREKKKISLYARSHHPAFWDKGVEEEKRMKSRISKMHCCCCCNWQSTFSFSSLHVCVTVCLSQRL